MKPHKHATVIKAWADNQDIQIQYKTNCTHEWRTCYVPEWDECHEYRVKHKHQDLIDAHAKGAKIQYIFPNTGAWIDISTPSWSNHIEYRIKPETTPNVYKHVRVILMPKAGLVLIDESLNPDNVKFTFDGETNELISVEKI